MWGAGKRRSARVRKRGTWIKTTLITCAWAAVRVKTSTCARSSCASGPVERPHALRQQLRAQRLAIGFVAGYAPLLSLLQAAQDDRA